MATASQPPRPPVPPPPPQAGSHIVSIVLLVLGLIVLVSILAVSIGLRFLPRALQVRVDEHGNKEVSIKTPVGSLEVAKDVNEAALGLPIYPGATRVKDEDSATVNIGVPGEEKVRILAAKFETSDPLEKVRDFYKGRLGSEVTKFTEKSQEGKVVFEMKHNDQDKIVALKQRFVDSRTRIELVRIVHGRAATN